MRAVDHYLLRQPLGGESGADFAHVLGIEIRAREGSTAQNHVTSVVAGGLKDRRHAFFLDRRNTSRGRRVSTASTAVRVLPSVPFFKPTGIERPDASSR